MTNNKPILCNEEIIPAAEAELFPTLKGLNSLKDEIVDIPDFFVRNNRKFPFYIFHTLGLLQILFI